MENKMGVMPVNKLLLSMSVPMVISMLVQAMYNIVDSMFVAQISEDALTAVSLAFPVQNLMIAVATGTGVGVNALLSKSLGEKNREMVDKSAKNGIFLTIMSSVVFILLGVFFSKTFFEMQNNIAPAVVEYGAQYLSVVTVFSIALFGQVMFERLLQSTGKTLLSMVTQLTGAIINIILDPILIFGLLGFPKMGVTGAAVATVIGQAIALIIGLILNIRYNKEICFTKGSMKPERHMIARIYAVGLPSIVMVAIASIMTYCINQILMAFTSTAAAVFGSYFKLQSFVFMPVFGLNNGMIPIIAYNYGAKRPDRIRKTIKLSVIYAMSIMAVGLAAFMILPDKLLLIFNASQNMLEIGVPALRIISISFIFAGFCIVSGSVFQALGDGVKSLIVSVARQLVVLVPVAYLLSLTGELDMVWLAFPIAEVASLTVTSIFLRRILRQRVDTLELEKTPGE